MKKWYHVTCKWEGERKDLTEVWFDSKMIGVVCPRCGDEWPFWEYENWDFESFEEPKIEDSKTKELWRKWYE